MTLFVRLVSILAAIVAFFAFTSFLHATPLNLKVRREKDLTIIEAVHSYLPGTNRSAWIAFYREEAANRDYISYTFLANLTDRLYDVDAPSETGRYVFRLFADSSYNHIAVSETIEVTPDGTVSVVPGKTSSAPVTEKQVLQAATQQAVPRQSDALEQFYYAMENYYFPAALAEGAARESLCRQAVNALSAVKSYYPGTSSSVLNREVEFYLGMSRKAIGEDRAAADNFLAVIREEITDDSNTRGFGTAMSYRIMAVKQIRSLQHALTPEERSEVQYAR